MRRDRPVCGSKGTKALKAHGIWQVRALAGGLTVLLRLASRVGSSMLSEVVRGLIGTIRGDDQTIYFEMLSHDMRKVEQNRLEKAAQRQPGKIRKYSMLMLLCIVLIYAVVLCTEMIGSLGAIF